MKTQDWVEPYRIQFQKEHNVLSLDQFLDLVEKDPKHHARGSAQYLVDMMDHFGSETVQLPEGSIHRYKVFDDAVVGHESIQNEIYHTLQSYARMGQNHRLILLHGPNGSAKSTITRALMQGLEKYSHEPEGAIFTFSWVFPADRLVRSGLGIAGNDATQKSKKTASYAFLTDDELACVIPCETRDTPLLLLPVALREKLLGSHFSTLPERYKQGGPSPRDQRIFEALLQSAQGDLTEVFRHIRVERFYLSRAYRAGLVSIEPQLHVDGNYQQLTMNRSLSSLPSSLQGMNLFSLSGDLVDGNRGLIDYADLLKRPLDSFKYLLTVCESGAVGIGNAILHLDSVLIGSSNELQLDGFKEYPDFGSFKGRLELIRVPYLLRVDEEESIYLPLLEQISGPKAITPHSAWAIAFWAVLTRLKKPQREHYPAEVRHLIDRIRPIDKLRMHNLGELPEDWSPEERLLLKPYLRQLLLEYRSVPYYEGRSGASARELKGILMDAAQGADYPTLSPLAIIQQLNEFVTRTSEYEFLRQDPLDGYHDPLGFIELMLEHYTEILDREVREALGLYDVKQWSEFIKRYILQISSILKQEKIKNTHTGKMEDPDLSLTGEFESIVGAPVGAEALLAYRRGLISQIGAWVLDHPKTPVDYFKVFPELKQRLEKHYFESQKSVLLRMSSALQTYGTESEEKNSEGHRLAHKTLKNMQENYGYNESGAIEVITFLLRRRYAT
jgi:serine protein kinase